MNMLSRRTKKLRKSRGLSLLEILAVITILAIIAVMVIPRIAETLSAAREKSRAQNRTDIDLAVERWYFEKGTWPADNLSDIGADTTYFPNGFPINPTNGTAYTLDSTTHRVN